MEGQMKAQIYYGPGDVKLERINIPQIGPGEILVKIKSALTCGSDLKTYRKGHPTMIKEGSVFGHEWAGDVVETGSKVKGFKPGDRIVAMNTVPCCVCYYCKHELYSLCENLIYNNGAYAEYIRIPSDILRINTLRIPDSMTYKEAALTEPLACVVHGADISNITEGDMVAVNGAGPIGLLWVVLAKLKGARVISTDLSDERLGIARELGADFTINAAKVDDQAEAVKNLTEEGRGVDIAVDVTGCPNVWENALRMGRKGSTINLFGGCPVGTTVTIETKMIHYSELKIIGTYHHTPYYVKKAFKLIENKQINAAKFITADMPLENLIDALKLVEKRKGLKYNILT